MVMHLRFIATGVWNAMAQFVKLQAQSALIAALIWIARMRRFALAAGMNAVAAQEKAGCER